MQRGGAKIEVVDGQIGGWTAGRTRGFGSLQGGLDDARDVRRDPVLQFEDIFEGAVETVGPKMRAGGGIDQLAADAQPIAAFAHRAFEHIADAELASDLLDVGRLTLEGEARIASEDNEPTDAGERGDDLLDHAIDEIILFRVAAQIGERQHSDRGLVRRLRRLV